jgi:putative NADPH-quinone reductase
MKVLAINGSPRGEKGCTQRMLDPLLEGMREAGAETEVVFLSQHRIEHCKGCFACWLKTPGKCIIQDDMSGLLQSVMKTDLLIIGTPLYFFSVSGFTKDFMDRLLPSAEPFLVENEKYPGTTTHLARDPKSQKLLLVSPCGFPEIEHFSGLKETFRCWVRAANYDYAGEILRPMGGVLNVDNLMLKLLLIPYFRNLKKAGKQLIQQGAIDEDTKQALLKDLIPGGAKAYRERANEAFREELEKLGKK